MAAEAHAAEVRRAAAAAAAFELRAAGLASDLEKAVGARAFAERDREGGGRGRAGGAGTHAGAGGRRVGRHRRAGQHARAAKDLRQPGQAQLRRPGRRAARSVVGAGGAQHDVSPNAPRRSAAHISAHG